MKSVMKLASAALAVCLAAGMFAGCGKALPTITVNAKEDMANLKIGAQDGTTGFDYASEIASDVKNVVGYKTGMDAALGLKAGNIDCIILDELPAQSIVSANDDLMIVGEGFFDPEAYAIAVKKGNTELLESINNTLATIEADGTYSKMVETLANGKWSKFADKSAGNSEVLKMGTNAGFKPFEYIDTETDSVVGFDIIMSQEIAAGAGKKLEVVDMAFDSLLMALDSGTVDFVAAGMTVNPERLQSVDFSEPYFNSQQVVIVRKPPQQ